MSIRNLKNLANESPMSGAAFMANLHLVEAHQRREGIKKAVDYGIRGIVGPTVKFAYDEVKGGFKWAFGEVKNVVDQKIDAKGFEKKAKQAMFFARKYISLHQHSMSNFGMSPEQFYNYSAGYGNPSAGNTNQNVDPRGAYGVQNDPRAANNSGANSPIGNMWENPIDANFETSEEPL